MVAVMLNGGAFDCDFKHGGDDLAFGRAVRHPFRVQPRPCIGAASAWPAARTAAAAVLGQIYIL